MGEPFGAKYRGGLGDRLGQGADHSSGDKGRWIGFLLELLPSLGLHLSRVTYRVTSLVLSSFEKVCFTLLLFIGKEFAMTKSSRDDEM